MVHKQLWKRKEFTQENKENIASNFYPIQSAIAIRDQNSKKQVTIMTEQCQGGSAGMRNKSNIEFKEINTRYLLLFVNFSISLTYKIITNDITIEKLTHHLNNPM